jgi:hypothetical protein
VQELKENSLWWNGPDFLNKVEKEWPKMVLVGEIAPEIAEIRQSNFLSSSVIEKKDPLVSPSDYSVGKLWDGHLRCIRVTALVLRAVKRFKLKIRSSQITKPFPSFIVLERDELLQAELYQIKISQNEHFSEEIELLLKKEQLSKQNLGRKSDIENYLPFLSDDGILRSKSRLELSDLPTNVRIPIILHRRSPFVLNLAMSLHKRIAHPIGILALKAKLQEDYAIKGVGNLVKQVGFLCQKCRHDKQKAATQQMAPLPKFRSSIPLRAFARTGLDFAGPFLIKVGHCKARKKASVFVLTCLNTRAIHLEVCPSQDTNLSSMLFPGSVI